MVEMQHICLPSLPPLTPPSGCPWLFSYDACGREDTGHIFSSIDANSHYHCRIPQLLGRTFLGCFHGWLILCKSADCHEFSLWNPVTLDHIALPPLSLRPFGRVLDICPSNLSDSCCLSSPPSSPDSIFLILAFNEPCIIFCMLSGKRKMWKRISYGRTTGGNWLHTPVSCNGILFAVTSRNREVIRIDVSLRGSRYLNTHNHGRVGIQFTRCGKLPQPPPCPNIHHLLESCGELVAILLCYEHEDFEEFRSIHAFKMDLSIMRWEKLKTAKDRSFFLHELQGPGSHFSCTVAESGSGQGGYIHIIRRDCEVYSYNMEDKTIAICALQCLQPSENFIPNSLWVMLERSSLGGDHGDAKHKTDTPSKEEQGKEAEVVMVRDECDRVINEGGEAREVGERLANLPCHILELIAEHCGVIGYLRLRSTCKHIRLAVPPMQLQVKARPRLRTHSSVSPWLMLLDRDEGVMVFTDPESGEKYFMSFSEPDVIGDCVICCSRYGWLLIFRDIDCLVFYNPFTRAIVHLPRLGLNARFSSHFASFGFSAPPNNPDCVVVGFRLHASRKIYITSPGKTEWYTINVTHDVIYTPSLDCTPSFCDLGIYVWCDGNRVGMVTNSSDNAWEIRQTDWKSYPCQFVIEKCFIVECDNDILTVNVGEFGKQIEVWKLNRTSLTWERVNSLGKHMIFVSRRASFSAVAKTPGMENKIYFSSLYGKNNNNIVFYSLDTCNYHTIQDKQEAFKDLSSARECLSSVWIEPSWLR